VHLGAELRVKRRGRKKKSEVGSPTGMLERQTNGREEERGKKGKKKGGWLYSDWGIISYGGWGHKVVVRTKKRADKSLGGRDE